MHDSFFVRRRDRIRERPPDLHYSFDRQCTFRDQLLQRLSFDKFHGQEERSVCLFDRINRDDVGMIERRHRACFAPESRQRIGIVRHSLRQQFQRHVAPQLGIRSPVHFAHSAGSDGGNDLVMA
jgi:hypothetical protein